MSRRFTIILSDTEWARLKGITVVENRCASSVIHYLLGQYFVQHKPMAPTLIKYTPQIPKFDEANNENI